MKSCDVINNDNILKACRFSHDIFLRRLSTGGYMTSGFESTPLIEGPFHCCTTEYFRILFYS